MTQVTNTAAHAATALRDAAESTVHTLSGLMGDAHDRLDHVHLPAIHAPSVGSLSLPSLHRRPSRGRVAAPWIVAIAIVAAVALTWKRTAKRRDPQLAQPPVA